MARHGEDLEREILRRVTEPPAFGKRAGRPGIEPGDVERYLVARYAEYCLFAGDDGCMANGQPANIVALELFKCLNVSEYILAVERYLLEGKDPPEADRSLFDASVSKGLVKLSQNGSELVTLLHAYTFYSADHARGLEQYASRDLNKRLTAIVTDMLSKTSEELDSEFEDLREEFPSKPYEYERDSEGMTDFVLRNLYLRFWRMLHGWYRLQYAPFKDGFEDLRLVLESMESERKLAEESWCKHFLTVKQVLTPSTDRYLRAAFLKVEQGMDDRSLLRLGFSNTDIGEARRLIPRLRRRLQAGRGEPTALSMYATRFALNAVLPSLIAPDRIQSGQQGLRSRRVRPGADA